jgi:hypothetical protein
VLFEGHHPSDDKEIKTESWYNDPVFFHPAYRYLPLGAAALMFAVVPPPFSVVAAGIVSGIFILPKILSLASTIWKYVSKLGRKRNNT